MAARPSTQSTLIALVLFLAAAVPASAQGPDDLAAASPPTVGASVESSSRKGVAPASSAPAGDDEIVSIIVTFDETVARIEGVTLNDVSEIAEEIYGSPKVIGAVGPFSTIDLERYVG